MKLETLFVAFFFGILFLLLYLAYGLLSVFFAPLAWAALLAMGFGSAQAALTRRLGGREGAAAGILTLGVIAFVMLPTVFLGVLLAGQSVGAYRRIQSLIAERDWTTWLEGLRASLPPWVPSWVDRLDIDVPSSLATASAAATGYLASKAGAAVANAARFVLDFVLTTVILFFFLRDGPAIANYLRSVIPMDPANRDEVFSRIYETLNAVVRGTLITAAAQGLLATLGYWIADVPFPVLLGFATALLSFLPGGVMLIWVPIVGYLGFIGSYGRMTVLLLWSVLIVGMADNVLRPLLIGGRVEVPTLLLFLGILGGLQVYGLLGIFFGPVLIAVLVAFLRTYRDQYLGA